MEKTIIRNPDTSLDVNYSSPRFKVGIIGSSRGAGATYACSYVLQNGLFTGSMPDGIRTVVELGSPYYYVALGMEKRFSGREFHGLKSLGPIQENREMGYDWCLLRPGDVALTTQEKFRAIYGAPGNVIIYDLSAMQEDPDLFAFLSEMDLIYLVLDPLPSRLLDSRVLIERIVDCFPKTEIVVNKFGKGIHRAQLSRFLGTSDYHVLEAIPIENFYRAEYNCTLVRK